MLIRKEITPEQARYAMDSGEFGSDIIQAGPNVAVVMTQGWCSQWHFLETGLRQMERDERPADKNIHVFTLVYDQVDYFEEFLTFKERSLGNMLVPYVRYYRDGKLIDQSNYVSPLGFIDRFGAD